MDFPSFRDKTAAEGAMLGCDSHLSVSRPVGLDISDAAHDAGVAAEPAKK